MDKKKILVIDNESHIVQIVKERMEPIGYEVIGVCDGHQGLKKAESEKPDVILLDIVMPRMHGFEICKKLKNNRKTKDIPVIIMTAGGLEDVVKDEPDLQVETCIAKPFDLKELIDTVRNAIEKRSKK